MSSESAGKYALFLGVARNDLPDLLTGYTVVEAPNERIKPYFTYLLATKPASVDRDTRGRIHDDYSFMTLDELKKSLYQRTQTAHLLMNVLREMVAQTAVVDLERDWNPDEVELVYLTTGWQSPALNEVLHEHFPKAKLIIVS